VDQDTINAIVRASQENGIDPAVAIAMAERESDGKVGATTKGSSAFGLFQLLKAERDKYGGNTQDPYEQSTAWAKYIQGTKSEMAKNLGRDPTGAELYLGHYFGGRRASRLVSGQIPPETSVQDIFTPRELRANPNFGKAGTAGTLMASIMSDINRRTNKYQNYANQTKDAEPLEKASEQSAGAFSKGYVPPAGGGSIESYLSKPADTTVLPSDKSPSTISDLISNDTASNQTPQIPDTPSAPPQVGKQSGLGIIAPMPMPVNMAAPPTGLYPQRMGPKI
jgi:hypothetical protein